MNILFYFIPILFCLKSIEADTCPLLLENQQLILEQQRLNLEQQAKILENQGLILEKHRIGVTVTMEPSSGSPTFGQSFQVRCGVEGLGPNRSKVMSWTRVEGDMPPSMESHGDILRSDSLTFKSSGLYRCSVETDISTWFGDYHLNLTATGSSVLIVGGFGLPDDFGDPPPFISPVEVLNSTCTVGHLSNIDFLVSVAFMTNDNIPLVCGTTMDYTNGLDYTTTCYELGRTLEGHRSWKIHSTIPNFKITGSRIAITSDKGTILVGEGTPGISRKNSFLLSPGEHNWVESNFCQLLQNCRFGSDSDTPSVQINRTHIFAIDSHYQRLVDIENGAITDGPFESIAGWRVRGENYALVKTNNGILLSGGHSSRNERRIDKAVNYTFLFDFSTGTYQKVGDLNVARHSHAMIVVDNKIYAIGGLGGEDREWENGWVALDSVEIWSDDTNTWTLSDIRLSQGRSGFATLTIPVPPSALCP